MSPFRSLSALLLLSASLAVSRAAKLPEKIYGVNLGSWLLIEPWMLPNEWVEMGGEICDDCSTCIASEYAFAKAYGAAADAKFEKHWKSWFNETDVRELVGAGINTVRVPLGYWIVEPLVDRKTEFYPKGGIHQLRRGLKQLRDAGITVILDHHALPGVSSANQMFAGRCTSDVQFYTPKNYHRALIWTGVMTALTHLDPAFSAVASIHAVNEIEMDGNKTPGYGEFQKNFVQVVRAVELLLGIPVPGLTPLPRGHAKPTIASVFSHVSQLENIFNAEVRKVLVDMLPVLLKVALQISLNLDQSLGLARGVRNTDAITTNFMDVTWQWNNEGMNPADAAIGPQIYDNHLYYNWGWVAANHSEAAYLEHNCNLDRLERSAARGNSPMYFGEWSLATGFEATDEFMKKWADSQKLNYGKGAGWIFWNFKIEPTAETARAWSYMEGLRRGYLTKDPSKFNDPDVCVPWVRTT